MTIHFYLNKKSDDVNKAFNIFCYIRGLARGKTLTFQIHAKIEPKYWDVEKERAKRSFPSAFELNKYIDSIVNIVEAQHWIYRTNNPIFDYDDFKAKLLAKFKQPKVKMGFFEVFDKFIETNSVAKRGSTVGKYSTLKKHLMSFEEYSKKKITFNGIDFSFWDEFSNYLTVVKQQANNTKSKNLDIFKAFMNWATKRKFNFNTEYNEFTATTDAVDQFFLTLQEFISIYYLDLRERPALEQTRDVFLFQTFTGQRFSDLQFIKREQINGNYWKFSAKKTKKKQLIPLNDLALAILDRYKENEKPLPIISGQKTNEHLKEIAKLTGIMDAPFIIVRYRGAEKIEIIKKRWECISTHSSRRAFVSLSLQMKARPETIKMLTGHSSIREFETYINVNANTAMDELNNIWNSENLEKLLKEE